MSGNYVIYSDDLEDRLPAAMKSVTWAGVEEGSCHDDSARCVLVQDVNNQLVGNVVGCFFSDDIMIYLEPIEDIALGMMCARSLEKVILERAGEKILLEPTGPVDFYYDTADPIFQKLVWIKFSVSAD